MCTVMGYIYLTAELHQLKGFLSSGGGRGRRGGGGGAVLNTALVY